MRNAILEVIGLLIKELSTAEDSGDAEQQKRQLEGFYELLFERFLDLNSYVRSKVATVLIKTCEYVFFPASAFVDYHWGGPHFLANDFPSRSQVPY